MEGPQTIGGGMLGAPLPPPEPTELHGTIGQGGGMPPSMPPVPGGPAGGAPMARPMPVGPPMGGDAGRPPVVFPPQIQGFQPNPAGDAGRGAAAKRALMGLIQSTGSQGRG